MISTFKLASFSHWGVKKNRRPLPAPWLDNVDHDDDDDSHDHRVFHDDNDDHDIEGLVVKEY